ncbi:MAG: nicotinate-nucleotide adenylyltransferase [Lachnospiraceae bacterium]|jgi:nicotinate-nucleotide adenylyltransferase|nr:nicotinate-nucleotide adenylyltransferase [Lachnospiraceae bacterium]
MSKIGIMGGTFDPIHKGHLQLAEFVYKDLKLDSVWFMPNANPPHKDNKKIVSDAKHRVEMVSLAIRNYPGFKLSTFESEKSETSYTYKTLEELKTIHPNDDFYFIIGTDSLFSILSWVHPEKIFPLATLVVIKRTSDGWSKEDDIRYNDFVEKLETDYGAKIIVLNHDVIPASSTHIRNMIHTGENLDDFLPKEIIDYIDTHDIYE